MSLPKHFNFLMASALSVSIAATPAGFAPAFAQSAPAAEAPGDSGWQKEFELWRTSNKGGKITDYQTYLRVYPNGKFANVAKRRIEELSASTQAPADGDETAAVADATKNVTSDDGTRDLEMWRQVSKTGKLDDYRKYLKEFPNGKFAKVAKTRIETLTASTTGDQPEEDVAADRTQDAAPADDAQEQAQAQDQVQNEDQAQAEDAQQDATEAETAQDDSQQPAGNADWEQEYALWKAASDGNTVTEYEAYLRAYPNGKFAAIAQARIAQLAAAEQPDPTIAEGDQQDDSTTANNARKRKNNAVEPADDQAAQQDAEPQPGDDQDQDMVDQGSMQDDQQANSNMGGLKTKQNTRNQQQAEFTEGSEDIEDSMLDGETRRELQGRLSSLGYDTLGTDGVFGPRSRDAIASWQQDNGAPVTGYLSEDQVEAIFTASAATYA
ncbi:MAG TPA: peptidoglycan-binding protein, partial [Rhizobiales bacterium]|nr:peptidoglycan-binding protein [Hyphomicrobiales bacterium]